MLSLRLLTGAVFAGVLACACSAADLSTHGLTSQPATGGKAETGESPNLGGAKSHGQPSAGGKPGTGSSPDEEDAGAAGASAGQAGAIESAPPPPPPSCELDRTCTIEGEATVVHCAVDYVGFTCEFEGFKGATAEISGGRRAVIGTACCGGCGCTPVEVYFDGTYCWQGIPQCELPQFSDQVFSPHLPTDPNPTFKPPTNVPGTFYLGTGGFGGAGGSPSTHPGGAEAGGRSGADAGGGSAGRELRAGSDAGGASG